MAQIDHDATSLGINDWRTAAADRDAWAAATLPLLQQRDPYEVQRERALQRRQERQRLREEQEDV